MTTPLIGVPGMNGDVAVSGGDPVLVIGAAGGRDFHRLFLGAHVCRASQRSGANQTKNR